MQKTSLMCLCGEPMYELPETHPDNRGCYSLQCQNPECSGRVISEDSELALDLFCGVGGVCRALQKFGDVGARQVIGVEIDSEKQEQYPGYFIQHDLTEGLPDIVKKFPYTVVWASPPCQFATGLQYARSGENLIPVARELVQQVESLFTVIENVPDAREHLEDPITLCGSAFDLGVKKHRVFETSFDGESTECDHPEKFDYCIGDREAPVTGYRKAHGLRESENIRTKQVRECIPVQYVEELWNQYMVSTGGFHTGRREVDGTMSSVRLFS